jgi:hypothetical protein
MIDRRPRPSSHERWWKPLRAAVAAPQDRSTPSRRIDRRLSGGGLCLLAAGLAMGQAAQRPVDWSGVTGGSSIRAGSAGSQGSAPPAPRFDRSAIPSQGRQVAEMAVEEFGRYSVRVTSASGMALQLVDRMSGWTEPSGVAGERDGRIDVFLDRGATRVVAHGPALGRGEARLSAEPFRELEPSAVRLVEGRLVSTSLGDLEQRSWWIDVPARREVLVEAAGRFLNDLRLWQNGSWLIDAVPVESTVEPSAGRPLALRQIVTTLEPGLYRVTAYGGPETPWSVSGAGGDSGRGAQPLHLRFGVDTRNGPGREAHTVSAFGFDRFVLPGSSTLVRLETPAPPAGKSAVRLGLVAWEERQPLPVGPDVAGASAEITKESNPPATYFSRGRTPRPFVVEVHGAAGQPYTLQHFAAQRRVPLDTKPSQRWVGTIHAGAAVDSLDATGVLFAVSDRPQVLAAQAVELSSTRVYRRRFNLFAPAELFLRVTERGAYELAANGPSAEFRLEPLLYTKPNNYRTPAARIAPTTWTLDPGYYVLSMTPTETGVLELTLAPQGASAASLRGPGTVYGAVDLGEVTLKGATSYVLWTANQGGVESGLQARAVPLDLREPLALSLRAGEERTVRFLAPSKGTVRAADDQAGWLDVAALAQTASTPSTGAEAAAFSATAAFEAGERQVRVRNASDQTRLATLTFTATEREVATPLPVLAPEALAALPTFEPLEEGAARPFRLERGASKTFLVQAREPGLYAVETQGLLAIGGALRTRVQPSLIAAEQNGVGRNLALLTYLREGDYQLTVRALGLSAGDASISLARAALLDGGRLAAGVPARFSLDAGEAVAMTFAMTSAATSAATAARAADTDSRVHFDALRLGGRYDVRFEDLQGWPLGEPWRTGDVDLDVAPGTYRAILAPRALASRALVRYRAVATAAAVSGHGPHDLPLDHTIEAEWNEPAAGAERTPDRFVFELPAPAAVDVALGDEMEGRLSVVGDGAAAARAAAKDAVLKPGATTRLELPAGRYALDAVCSRRDSRHTYRLSVTPVEWVDGIDRPVSAPSEIAVSIGREGILELSSFGDADVRARLLDASGTQLALADDRPNDWNFLVSRRVPAGRYHLRIDPVGTAEATTRVALHVPAERLEAPATGSARRTVALRDDVVVVPIERPAAAAVNDVFAATLEPASAEGKGASLGLTLEREYAGAWSAIGSGRGERPWLAVPVSAGDRLRLRLSSLDARPLDARLLTFFGAPAQGSESALTRGLALAPLGDLPVSAIAVPLERPGCFATSDEATARLAQARRRGDAAAPAAEDSASASATADAAGWVADGDTLWLFSRRTSPAPRATARRVALGEAPTPFRLRLAPGEKATCDLSPAPSPRRVEATALAGQPLLRVPGSPADRQVAVRPRRATLFVAPEARALEISNPSRAALEVAVTARPLSGAVRTASPAGAKRLRVTLAPDSWALVGPPSRPAAFLAPDEDHAVETALETDALEWTLFSPLEDTAARPRIEALPLDPSSKPAGFAGDRFELRTDRSGRLLLAVPQGGSAHATRRLSFIARRATFVSASGDVVRSSDGEMTLGDAAGTLDLEHDPGFVVAWFEGAPALAASGNRAPRPVVPPVALRLDEPRQAFAVESREPALLSVRVGGPTSVALLPAAPDSGTFAAFPQLTRFFAPVAAGATQIHIAGLAGETPDGLAEVTLEPIGEVRDGLGAPFVVPSGGARAFGFGLTERRDIGLGVAADSGEIELTLHRVSPAARVVGRGTVQRRWLEPGRYVVIVEAAPDAPATVARLGVVGLAPPSEGPPGDEVARFLQLAGAAASSSGAPGAGDGGAVTGSEDRLDPFADESVEETEECFDCADESWDEAEGEVR